VQVNWSSMSEKAENDGRGDGGAADAPRAAPADEQQVHVQSVGGPFLLRAFAREGEARAAGLMAS